LTINILPKLPLRLGTSESTQSQPTFLQHTDYQHYQTQQDGYVVENLPIKYAFPSFIMAFVFFLPGCYFICHEMEP